LGLGVGLAAYLEQSTPKLDPVTLRSIGRPSTGTVSVLIDRTDPLTTAEQRALVDRMRELDLHGLRSNDLLTVWELGTTEEGPLRQVFAKYFPGREANRLWGNPEATAARCDNQFWSQLLAALRSIPTHAGSSRSPLLAAIHELSEQEEFTSHTTARRVVVVSDLMENSPAVSFYRKRPDFAEFRTTPAFPALRADLRGAVVEVLYITRPCETPVDAARVREFWRACFRHEGAASVSLERL
jgi:hypothetical protein